VGAEPRSPRPLRRAQPDSIPKPAAHVDQSLLSVLNKALRLLPALVASFSKALMDETLPVTEMSGDGRLSPMIPPKALVAAGSLAGAKLAVCQRARSPGVLIARTRLT
jgi:hypothetical protein